MGFLFVYSSSISSSRISKSISLFSSSCFFYLSLAFKDSFLLSEVLKFMESTDLICSFRSFCCCWSLELYFFDCLPCFLFRVVLEKFISDWEVVLFLWYLAPLFFCIRFIFLSLSQSRRLEEESLSSFAIILKSDTDLKGFSSFSNFKINNNDEYFSGGRGGYLFSLFLIFLFLGFAIGLKFVDFWFFWVLFIFTFLFLFIPFLLIFVSFTVLILSIIRLIIRLFVYRLYGCGCYYYQFSSLLGCIFRAIAWHGVLNFGCKCI